MNDLDPALLELVKSLARAAAAKAVEEERRNPPNRTGGHPVEIAPAHRVRRRVSNETALQRAVEAALAAGAAPVRAELFANGRILLFFDGSGPPGAAEDWREMLATSLRRGGGR